MTPPYIPPDGTPHTLEQAIRNGLDAASLSGDLVTHLRVHVKDFLAQKFTVAMALAPTPEEKEKLQQLFDEITKEEI